MNDPVSNLIPPSSHALSSAPAPSAPSASILDIPTPIILGPTGSGKTAVSLEFARALKSKRGLESEIISADSRAIYQGLDLGTAKPTREEQASVPHHALDLVTLADRFTVADWKSYAEQKIYEIRSRNRLPLIVGGTGLYIDALIFDYHFHGPTGAKINDFEQKSCSDRKEIKGNFLLIGLDLSREELRDRLCRRIEQMFTPELFEESKKVVQFAKSDPKVFAKAGNIYRFAAAYLNGELSLAEAKEKAFYADYHLAKRQLTWFKRNPAIVWLPSAEVVGYALDKIHPNS